MSGTFTDFFIQAFTIGCGNHWSDRGLLYKNDMCDVSPITIKPLKKKKKAKPSNLKYLPLLKIHKSLLLLAEF